MTAAKCPGCGHASHRDQCRGKAPTGCAPVLDPANGRQIGIGCSRGARLSCPCPYGACHTCRAPIAGATPFPLTPDTAEVDIDRGSAGAPDGTWAVRKLAGGTLACRRLADGEQPGDGEWRGRAHVHQLAGAPLKEPQP